MVGDGSVETQGVGKGAQHLERLTLGEQGQR